MHELKHLKCKKNEKFKIFAAELYYIENNKCTEKLVIQKGVDLFCIESLQLRY